MSGKKNGSYEKLAGVNNFQQDENGNFYYDVSGITSTRYASCFGIEFTTSEVDNNSFMVSLNTVPDKYMPFGNILYSEGEKVLVGSELQTLVTNDNTSLGKGSMTEESNSKYNVAIGVNTMKTVQNKGQVDEGYYNVAVGHNAMPLLENGSHNTAIGFQALNKVVKGHYNTACGEDALFNTTGSNNTGCGCRALQDNTSGTHNVAVGGALGHNTEGFRNNAVGNGAGNSVTKDSRCNFFGFEADKNTDEIITNSMALGHSAKVTKSNQVVIGNASVEEFVLGNKRIVFDSDGTVTWESLS